MRGNIKRLQLATIIQQREMSDESSFSSYSAYGKNSQEMFKYPFGTPRAQQARGSKMMWFSESLSSRQKSDRQVQFVQKVQVNQEKNGENQRVQEEGNVQENHQKFLYAQNPNQNQFAGIQEEEPKKGNLGRTSTLQKLMKMAIKQVQINECDKKLNHIKDLIQSEIEKERLEREKERLELVKSVIQNQRLTKQQRKSLKYLTHFEKKKQDHERKKYNLLSNQERQELKKDYFEGKKKAPFLIQKYKICAKTLTNILRKFRQEQK